MTEYKRRRANIEQEAAEARARLTALDDQPDQPPAAATITGFAQTWSTLDVDTRRDVTGALLTAVRVNPDRSVELLPRWGQPVSITFTKRGTVAILPDDVSNH